MAPRNKYNNHKCQIVNDDGTITKFDSEKEKQRYLQLCILQNVGEIKDLQMQVKFELIPKQSYLGKNYRNCCYIADFTYTRTSDNKKICEDVKGFNAYKKGWSTETPEFKIKMKLFIQKYGDEYEFHVV